jgi:hypothetical protein
MSSAKRRFSCIDARNTACFLSIWSPHLMKYVHTGPTFKFILLYISVSPVRHEQYRRPDTAIDLVHCILGKFLEFFTLVARCLYFCKDARVPSVKNWNYLSKVGHVMFRNDRFLAIYINVCCHKFTTSDIRWQRSYQLGVFFKKGLATTRYGRVLKFDTLIS